MPTVTLTTSIGIAATVQNVFDGIRAAKIPNIAGARFQVTYLSTAETIGEVTEELFVGAANPVELSAVSGLDRIPQSPEDIVTTFAANPGEEITLRVSNSGAAANNHHAKLVVTRVA